jgi:hypothetical protein
MKCSKPGCDGDLKVSHTYSEGAAKYQRGVCERCKQVHCLLTIAEPVERRGDGARARARRARQHPCESSS